MASRLHRWQKNRPLYESTFVLRAFRALHEGCLTLPLWLEMTYNIIANSPAIWINSPDTFSPFVSRGESRRILRSWCFSLFSLISLRRHGSRQLFPKYKSLAFQTSKCHHSGSTHKKLNTSRKAWAYRRVCACNRSGLLDFISEDGLDEAAGSHVTYKIFGSLMPGIFRPSLQAAVRSEASVRNWIPFAGQCFERLSFPPDPEQRRCLPSHPYQNTPPPPTPHRTTSENRVWRKIIRMGVIFP